MNLFPVFFGTHNLHVAVFGGGELARRKVRLLAKSHAVIHVISDVIEDAFRSEFEGRVEFGADVASLAACKFAIIALEDDREVLAALSEVKAQHLPVNVVDRPELCDFTVPSIMDRGSVVAGVATGGAAPILARNIRARLEGLMPKRIGALADFAKSFRPAVKAKFETEQDRRDFWEKLLTGPVAEKVLAGKEDEARADMEDAIQNGMPSKGLVHLVGAGPGDPELLTLKALRVLQDADIVFYDFLVGEGIMDLIRRDADRVCVGKAKSNHSVPQNQITEMMIEAAKAGKRVVRLKGGDPFIFGRGGEELAGVVAEGITAIVVPGISAAIGCAASNGLPLTHRDHAQAVTFVTGHAKQGGPPDLDWPSLSGTNHTLVVYMGVGMSAKIAEKLMEAGRSPQTPVAVIENGTRENEARYFGKLENLAELVEKNQINGPAILIIGEVAAFPLQAITTSEKILETHS